MPEAFNRTDLIFTDEHAVREHFEAIRWPHGPVCPRSGAIGESATKLAGKSHGPGLYQCNACREPFTVKMGSVIESSHIFLSEMGARVHLMASSRKGMSAHQLHRMLGVTYKTAWFLAHRIREAMREISPDALGGEGNLSRRTKPSLAEKR